MSKAQKIIIVLALFLMTLILLFPTTYYLERKTTYYYAGGPRRIKDLLSFREFVFTKSGERTIDTQRTIFELLAVAFIGGIVVILLDLKKKK